MSVRPRNFLLNLLLLCISTGLALVAAEIVLRTLQPQATFGAASDLEWTRNNAGFSQQLFMLDAEFGFRPRLGTSHYSEFGTQPNDYPLAKRPGVIRLLFIGDSVTRRGRIITALRQRYGDERFEYWNAGVESFNTAQEVAFYLRFNHRIAPDHVILTFHINDFQTTPVAFFDAEQNLVVYAPNLPMQGLSRWLFTHSLLYRWLIGLTLDQEAGRSRIEAEVQRELQRLRDALGADGIPLTVLFFPTLLPNADWTEAELRSHRSFLRIMRELEIPFFDLSPPLQQAMRVGADIQEKPGDVWHPSATVADYFAAYLQHLGFLRRD